MYKSDEEWSETLCWRNNSVWFLDLECVYQLLIFSKDFFLLRWWTFIGYNLFVQQGLGYVDNRFRSWFSSATKLIICTLSLQYEVREIGTWIANEISAMKVAQMASVRKINQGHTG